MTTTITTISPKQLRALAEAHIRRFENLLSGSQSGALRNVREDECHNYLAIWRSVLAKAQPGQHVAALTNAERDEVTDALTCGDYDDLMESSK